MSWQRLQLRILGTDFGAKLGGAPFLPSLGGSALGLGVGRLWAVNVGDDLYERDDDFVLFIAIPATMQAGITTLIASAFD